VEKTPGCEEEKRPFTSSAAFAVLLAVLVVVLLVVGGIVWKKKKTGEYKKAAKEIEQLPDVDQLEPELDQSILCET